LRATRVAIALLLLTFAGRARAEPIELVLAACVRGEAGAIRRIVEVELGPLAAEGQVAPRVPHVEVACDAGEVIVTVVDRERGVLRFRVDTSGVAAAARARLIALTIAEAVAASRIELAPGPVVSSTWSWTPRSTPHAAAPLPVVAGAAPAELDDMDGDIDTGMDAATLQGLGVARSLGAQATTFGGGVAVIWPIGAHAAAGSDLVAEGGFVPVDAGDVGVFLASAAPRLVARARGRAVVVEAGLGMRLGLARLSGRSSAPMTIEGRVLHAAWGGPIAIADARFPLGRASMGVGLEAGYTTLTVVGRIPMAPPVELRGAWLGVHLSAGFDLR